MTHSSFVPAVRSGSALTERTLYRRAVEAALWGMPLVSFGSIRHAYFHDAGAHCNDMVYWSNPDVCTKQTPAPHQTALALLFATLRQGPLILELPALRGSVFVSLFDAWSTPIPRGITAEEENEKGGKYVLLPPGQHASSFPAGYVPLRSPTFHVGCSVRVAPETRSAKELVRASILVKKLRIRPLLISASTPPSRFIDAAKGPFDAVPPSGAEFFARLAELIAEEPPRERDAAMLGLLGTLGIRKGTRFQPVQEMLELFESAVAEAVACLQEGRRSAGYRYWPTRQWRASVAGAGGAGAQTPDPFPADGVVGGLDVAGHETGTLCLNAFDDARGEPLDGSRTYHLRVPTDVPTRRFWSLAAYDEQTAAYIRDAAVVGVSSRSPDLVVGSDGTTTVCFGPRRPSGERVNWVATTEGRRFFVVFRNHGPERYVVAHTSRWTLGDLERTTDEGAAERSVAESG